MQTAFTPDGATPFGRTHSLKALITSWLLLACTVAFAQKDMASRLLTIEGRVEVARAGQAAWSAGSANQELRHGDRVRTGLRSRATIRLSDASVLVLKELTTLEVRPPQAPGASSSFDLKNGGSYFFNRERPGAVEFRTPVASGAIRGTEFHLLVAADGRTELALFDGAVELTNSFGSATLASGEQAVVEPNAAPRKSPMLEASSIIQWVLYYPAVLDPAELSLSDAEKDALSESLAAYRAGDLLAAQEKFPENRQPAGEAERVYRAAILLAVGQAEPATEQIANVTTPAAEALRQLIATVKGSPRVRGPELKLASEWLAESYALQAQLKLDEALAAARRATTAAPDFGFAWARVAELELSFGKIEAAEAALTKSLALSPRNAQAHAVAGFLQAARRQFTPALQSFSKAIEIDAGLANAWLGRGLVNIRQGYGPEGRRDLQVAAAREPNRSLLRSYLGKAWSHTRHLDRAEKELELAKRLDPNDPTPWLYSAILREQQNRVNEAIHDLERSQELNDNRSVFRSRLLLDEDKAVRSANLARIYQDAGMTDWSVREASRAASYDYANFSAHQFLANSYDALRDPRAINLRYEAPAVSEYFIANLLSPVGATPLSQTVSQQEYTRFFDRDHFGIASSTEYFSNGDWVQQGSQYGRYGPIDYSLDAYYRTENGQRPNNDLERMDFVGRFRAELTRQDTIYFEAQRTELESGDVAQYYDQRSANRTTRIDEVQNPNLYLGYHREWSPQSHTLALVGRLRDVFDVTNRSAILEYNLTETGEPANIFPRVFNQDIHDSIEGYTAELQQILKLDRHTLVVGGRYQNFDTEARARIPSPGGLFGLLYPNRFESVDGEIERYSAYAYDMWQVFEPLQFTFGVSYDHLSYPINHELPPLSDSDDDHSRFSPKAGFIYTPWSNTAVRGAYTRSLGGALFDNSLRLEPTIVGGFNQTFRSIIPESVLGNVPGSRFETLGLGVEQKFKTRTYVTISGEALESSGTRAFGAFARTNNVDVNFEGQPMTVKRKAEFEERSLLVSVSQLLGKYVAIGARYRLTDAELRSDYRGIPNDLLPDEKTEAILHQAQLYGLLNLPCGFFTQVDGIWSGQDNRGYSPALEDDDVFQLNAFVGYRFWRRHAEARIGVLNIADQDYRLNPLTLYSELPRERMFYASFKFYF